MSLPPRRPASRFGSTSFQERKPTQPRKRMMSTARKGHFMYDAKACLAHDRGALEPPRQRAFLEGLFQRGTRQSTADARTFLDDKLADETITKTQHAGLVRLVEQYSFWR